MAAIKLDVKFDLNINNPFDSIKGIIANNPVAIFAKEVFAAEERTTHAIQQWHDKTIAVLKENNDRLDEAVPPNKLQKLLHSFYQRKLAPILEHKNAAAFNAWIDSNGHGNWYQQLGTALAKLPLRAVRNILAQVHSLLKALIYTVVHPMKAMNDAAAFFVRCIYALTQPESYTKMGAGIIGASIGQSLMGFPIPTALGFGVGGGLMVAGIGYDALRTLVRAQQGQKWQNVKDILVQKHCKHIPEAFATGLISGAVAGIIQKCTAKPGITTQSEARAYMKDYLRKYDLGTPYGHWIEIDKNRIIVSWGWLRPKNLPHGYWTSKSQSPYLRVDTAYYSAIALPVKAGKDLAFAAHAVAQATTLGRRES